MINFQISPQSGYADSYFDIKFIVQFDNAAISEVRIYNDTTHDQLEILGISSGYIENEKTAIIKDTRQVEGYINLFNKDKMNKGLRSFVGVNVRCHITQYNNLREQIGQEEESITFYNQSQSLDGNIIPFDLMVINNHLDISNHEPLKMKIISDKESKYELSIRSEDGYHSCVFEILTKKNITEIEIPSEIIWFELGLSNLVNNKKFDIYWTKFEGIDHMKFLNRKYVRIDNTRITFSDTCMMPQATQRIGPTGKPLSSSFVISDKYLVHTMKQWSKYGGAIDGFGIKRLHKLTSFWHESQAMDNITSTVQSFGVKDSPVIVNEKEIRKAIWSQKRNSTKTIRLPLSSKEKKDILSGLTNIYNKRAVETMSSDLNVASATPTSAPLPKIKKSGGCGCSRKKNA